MSAKPQAPERQFSFESFSHNNPVSQQPGTQLDAEFDLQLAFAVAINNRLGEIQRDDGKLQNGSVGVDQLQPALLKGVGVNAPDRWVAGVFYTQRDTVFVNGGWYMCLTSHTSTDFTTQAALWRLLLPTSLAVVGDNTVYTESIRNGAVTSAKVAHGAIASDQLADNSVISSKLADTSVGSSKLADQGVINGKIADQSVSLEKLDGMVSGRLVPIGMPAPWLTDTPPDGWLLAYGQTISRTVYAALFSVFGTKYGAGDGATTFGLPDLRGRMFLMSDFMGGNAAGRVTSDVSGINTSQIGAVGGDQYAQKHQHGVTYSVPLPTYGVKDVNDDGSGAKAVVKQFNPTGSSENLTATTDMALGGNSQNIPPVIVCNGIVFAGTGGIYNNTSAQMWNVIIDGVTGQERRIVVNDGVIGVI